MGTMCNQPARPTRDIENDQMSRFCENVKKFADSHGLTYDQALKTFEVAVYDRRNDIMVDNGNFMDENMCGIGTAIKDVAEQLREIADSVSDIALKGE